MTRSRREPRKEATLLGAGFLLGILASKRRRNRMSNVPRQSLPRTRPHSMEPVPQPNPHTSKLNRKSLTAQGFLIAIGFLLAFVAVIPTWQQADDFSGNLGYIEYSVSCPNIEVDPNVVVDERGTRLRIAVFVAQRGISRCSSRVVQVRLINMTRQLANITANFARGSAIEVEPPHFGTTPRIGVHPRAAASIIDINYTLAPEAYGFFGIDADYSAYSEGWKNRKVYLPLLRLDCQDDSGEVTSEGVFGAPKCPVSGVIDSSASVGAVVESSEAVIGSTAPSDRP